MNLSKRRQAVAEAEAEAARERERADAAMAQVGRELRPHMPWLLVGGGFVAGLLLGRRRRAAARPASSRLMRGLGLLRLAERLLPLLVPAAALGLGAGKASEPARQRAAASRQDKTGRGAAHSDDPPARAEIAQHEHAQRRPSSSDRGPQRLH
jgi:hypothetical protein